MNKLVAVLSSILALSYIGIAQASDSALRSVVEKDRSIRTAGGGLQLLSPAEHLSRGQIYFDNRQFPEAREHLQKILDNFPKDAAVSSALFLIGRSYMWERQYARAIPLLTRVAQEYPVIKDGREGLAYAAACNVRLGNNSEAARLYQQYTVMYPMGEKIESAYLNIIDALRGSGKYDDADLWITKTRSQFPNGPTETNALQAKVRMEIYRGRWTSAIAAADILLNQGHFAGSMTSVDEAKYLKAFAIERSGDRDQARALYASIPLTGTSYFGGLASERTGPATLVRTIAQITPSDFPAAFRDDVVREAHKRQIDPRFVLAIMKQESTFRPGIKSPSAARGLLQLVFDTALKYKTEAGYADLQPDDLYTPRVNIAIGCEYIRALRDQFGGLYEAIAASYNGGEDNAARWLDRAQPKDPGIFAAEIGFAETKNYVFKVMNNFRVYKQLYDENLNRRG